MEYASKFFLADLPDLAEQILALCKKVEEYGRDEYIDGKILATAVHLVFWTGLKKAEFLNLTIGNVKCQNNGEIVDEIRPGNSQITISEGIKTLIQDHIAYLESAGYKTTRAQPLFPTTRKSSLKSRSSNKNGFYDDVTISRHIRTCLEGSGFSFQGFEYIRQAGICAYFERQKNSGEIPPHVCLIKTASFARCNEKEVIKIIRGFIQPATEDKSSNYDDLPRLSLTSFKNRAWIIPYDQYKWCIRFSLPRLLQGGGITVPTYIEDTELMNTIRRNFFKSLKLNSHLNDTEKTELKTNFEDTIQEAYKIYRRWREDSEHGHTG